MTCEMGESLKLSDGFNEMKDSIKEKVKTELNSLSDSLSENSTSNEILSQLKDKELPELKNSFLRTTAIQMKLKELEYNVGKIDGIYGEQTWNAVKKFQENNNVDKSKKTDGSFDGKAGKETMKKMIESNLKKGSEQVNTADKNNQTKNERKEKGADGKEYIIKKLEKFEDLPSGYTWKNDSIKYEIANPTDPKKIYRFYYSGIYKSPYDNKFYKTEGLVKNKIDSNKQKKEKNTNSSHKEIAKEYQSTIINQAKEIFREFGLTINNPKDLTVNADYKYNKIEFDISKYCDPRGNLVQKKQLKTDINNRKEQIDKKKNNEIELQKAEKFFKERTYTIDSLFKENPKVKGYNLFKKDDIKYTTFFEKFNNKTIQFDRDSKIDGENLVLKLDQIGTNKYKNIQIPLKDLGINPENFFFEKLASSGTLENNLRKALAKKIDEIVG